MYTFVADIVVSRPITSYGALDLPTYFLDLTPFVPILTDGQSHNFTIDVASAESDHATLQNWFVSGVLQVVTDPSSSSRTTGNITSYSADPFAQSIITGMVGTNGDVNVTVKATRNIHIEADVISGSGKSTHVVWSQNLNYTNVQTYLDNLMIQVSAHHYRKLTYNTHLTLYRRTLPKQHPGVYCLLTRVFLL